MELLEVHTLKDARTKLLSHVEEFRPEIEELAIEESLGRILAEDIICTRDVPDFRRSTVDGYAVRARDTMGASDGLPVFLKITEDIGIGKEAKEKLLPGTCAYVPTGGMLPEGADSCVMVEFSEVFNSDSVAIYQALAPGQAIVEIGEDLKAGETLLKKGSMIRAQEIGAMAANGMKKAKVFKPWRMSIISTGDELVTPGEVLEKGKIYDINTYALSGLAKHHGFKIIKSATIPDDEDFLREAISESMENSDIIILSGGSSKGKKDLSAKIINEMSYPGVFVHGLALKPGKPTILGWDKKSQTLIIGLPGHPVAAMAVFELLPVWLKKNIYGEKEELSLTARLNKNVPGSPGRQMLLFVKLIETEQGYEASPIFGKSGLISTLTEADGYALLELNLEGLKSGEIIQVHRF